MSKVLGDDFNSWVVNYLMEYKRLNERQGVIYYVMKVTTSREDLEDFLSDQIPSLITWGDKYIDSMKIDFSKYAVKKKFKESAKKASFFVKKNLGWDVFTDKLIRAYKDSMK